MPAGGILILGPQIVPARTLFVAVLLNKVCNQQLGEPEYSHIEH